MRTTPIKIEILKSHSTPTFLKGSIRSYQKHVGVTLMLIDKENTRERERKEIYGERKVETLFYFIFSLVGGHEC